MNDSQSLKNFSVLIFAYLFSNCKSIEAIFPYEFLLLRVIYRQYHHNSQKPSITQYTNPFDLSIDE